MAQDVYELKVEAESDADAEQHTRSLVEELRAIPDVIAVDRRREPGSDTMDLGGIVAVVATSAAAASIAAGVADWLRRKPRVKLTITRDGKAQSITLELENVDAACAARVIEHIRAPG